MAPCADSRELCAVPAAMMPREPRPSPASAAAPPSQRRMSALRPRSAATAREEHPPGTHSGHTRATISGAELESLGQVRDVGPCGADDPPAVGALIKVAVEHGPDARVRIGAGALAAILVGAAGLYFRKRDERGMEVCFSAWLSSTSSRGAPALVASHPTTIALGIVDVVAIALVCALSDGANSFGGRRWRALRAIVTSDGGCGAGLLLAQRTVPRARITARDPVVARIAVLFAGPVYSLAAGQLPISASWYGLSHHAVRRRARGALLFAEPAWRSSAAGVSGGHRGRGHPRWDRGGPRCL